HCWRGGARVGAERTWSVGGHWPGGTTPPQPPLRGAPRARQSAELPEHAEWIIGASKFGMKAGGVGTRRRPSAVHPHLPGRAMSDDRLLLIAGNVLGAHAGKEIVRMVVFANVIEAEPPIFALAEPPLGRAVGRGRLAIRPFAGRALGAQPTIFVGLDPDAVKQGRVAFHDRSVCARSEAIFKS